MRITKSEDTIPWNDFIEAPFVRDVCEAINDLGIIMSVDNCVWGCQNEAEIIRIRIMLVTQKIGDGIRLYNEFVAGSKDEKISVSIKT